MIGAYDLPTPLALVRGVEVGEFDAETLKLSFGALWRDQVQAGNALASVNLDLTTIEGFGLVVSIHYLPTFYFNNAYLASGQGPALSPTGEHLWRIIRDTADRAAWAMGRDLMTAVTKPASCDEAAQRLFRAARAA